jgi:hypothetical protein
MKVTRKTLRTLIKERPYTDYGHYRILAEEKVTKEVQHPIPYYSNAVGPNNFPEYLKGFEEYYKMGYHSPYTTQWILKPEYKENRPKYTYKVTYTVYDIELTEEGQKEVERRYNMYLRLTEKYARLLG